MTSYIKMVDIWMIFMMLYPFFEVCLYTLMESLKIKKNQIQMKKAGGDWINKDLQMNLRMTKTVHFSLDWALPILATLFIIAYWTLGLVNIESTSVESHCWNILSSAITLISKYSMLENPDISENEHPVDASVSILFHSIKIMQRVLVLLDVTLKL